MVIAVIVVGHDALREFMCFCQAFIPVIDCDDHCKLIVVDVLVESEGFKQAYAQNPDDSDNACWISNAFVDDSIFGSLVEQGH